MANPIARVQATAKTARSELLSDFEKKLQTDFAEHGAETIACVRRTQPTAYLRLIANLRPGPPVNRTLMDLSDDELERLLAYLGRIIGLSKGADLGTNPAPGLQPAALLPAIPQTV